MKISSIQDLFELNDIDIDELKNGEHSYVFKVKMSSDKDLTQVHQLIQSMKELCERCGLKNIMFVPVGVGFIEDFDIFKLEDKDSANEEHECYKVL